MTKIAVGFNEDGLKIFKEWVDGIVKYPEQMNAQAWFDSMEFAEWDTGKNTVIEFGSYYTKSGCTEIYIVPIEHVEFVDA